MSLERGTATGEIGGYSGADLPREICRKVFLKRYFLVAAAAISFALGVSGGALAMGHPAGRGQVHSLVPSFAPHPRAWLHAFARLSRHATSPHKAKPRHKTKARPAPRHRHRQAAKPKPTRQPRPQHQLKATTLSIYEQTVRPRFLSAQGCNAARRHESGVVVLDFGKPAYLHGGYGTILFSGHFAPNHRITAAMFKYARGYVGCLPKGSTATIELARGTSNYHPYVPSAYTAGVRWAHETNKLGRELSRNSLDAHVHAAAADDAEPAWDPGFRQTRQFFHGFRQAVHGHTLYDYGSLDGGVGAVWSAWQASYVAGGLRTTKALPEIYNHAMARQWAELARIARGRYHRPVHFAGVMTQGTSGCDCGLRPPAAHAALAHALDDQGIGEVRLPVGGTNIVG
jgi:hypothetical protein